MSVNIRNGMFIVFWECDYISENSIFGMTEDDISGREYSFGQYMCILIGNVHAFLNDIFSVYEYDAKSA